MRQYATLRHSMPKIIMCESPFVIPPGPHKFNFTLLYDFVTAIKAACPEDARLLVPDRVSLHNEACQSIVGEGWAAYEIDFIWSTVITWEALLFQLISQFQRAPLGFWAQAFTVVHLFGNPIDTIASFLYTLALCQFRARKFKKGGQNGRWKLATLVTISYDECGNDEDAMLQCLESM
jgi:hypothetical protein